MYAWERRTFSLFKTRHAKRRASICRCKSDLPWETAETRVVAADDSSLGGLLRGRYTAACNYKDVGSLFKSRISMQHFHSRALLEELVTRN